MPKAIALILFSIFFLVNTGPVVCSVLSGNSSVLIMDEDKNPSANEVKKEEKICNYSELVLISISGNIAVAFHCSERIHPSPLLEMPGLPPDLS